MKLPLWHTEKLSGSLIAEDVWPLVELEVPHGILLAHHDSGLVCGSGWVINQLRTTGENLWMSISLLLLNGSLGQMIF